jgi:hypothetical protein
LAFLFRIAGLAGAFVAFYLGEDAVSFGAFVDVALVLLMCPVLGCSAGGGGGGG